MDATTSNGELQRQLREVHQGDHICMVYEDAAEQMAAAGRDVEALVLARAVRWHVEHRVMLNGARTVVFR